MECLSTARKRIVIKGDILLKHNGVVIEDERDSSIERYFCLPAGEL